MEPVDRSKAVTALLVLLGTLVEDKSEAARILEAASLILKGY